MRPLPEGWVRTYDPIESHQFYVDTTKDPPVSSWVHPHDNEDYLSTLTSEERERLEEESFNRGRHQSKADITSAHTDDEDDDHPTASSSRIPNELPPRTGKANASNSDTRSFGRKFKDKVTGMTHEERERERAERARREQQMYERHLHIRQAMTRAAQTGQPQLVGKDGDGKDIYIEPPAYRGNMGGMGGMGGYGGMGGMGGGYPGRGYAMDPYRGGVYTTPQARYIRPPNPYMRPRGYGYGGGYGYVRTCAAQCYYDR